MAIKLPGGRTIGLMTAGALAGSVLVLGGAATASSASDAAFYACVNKSTRYMRLVNATTTCKPAETKVSWNRTGPQGPVGIGGTGPQGPAGPQGLRGPQGMRGPQGLKGTDGKDGERGPAGPQGPKGIDGKDGKDGDKGDTGPRGLPGEDGKPGKDGKDGERGPAGPQGTKGADGKDGEDGKSAYEIWKAQPGNSGKTVAQFLASLKGEKGDPGDSGGSGSGSGGAGSATYKSDSFNFGGSGGTKIVMCEKGVATGGGYNGSFNGQFWVNGPYFLGNKPLGWQISGKNSNGTVYVLCM
ncbi:collagen-like protein [Microbispora sp. H10830]|uniref:collagen-like protein n=1 Tax=Microbispora sp. H10830 TaxID=2729109 RepID=UPI001C71820E|nr:collagen-like protein [Microbispora sp. H10830]